MLAGDIIAGIGNVAYPGVGEAVGSQEGTAAHTDIHIALQLQHLLLGNIVGNHPLGGTLGGQLGQIPILGALPDIVLLQHIDQLGESRGDPHALFIFDALIALAQGLLDDHGQILLLLLVAGLVEVHKDGDEGSLAVGGHQGHHLVLDGLDATADFLPQALLHDLRDLLLIGADAQDLHLPLHSLADLFPANLDKRCQVGQGNGLAAVLIGGHLGNDLCCDIAGGGEGMGLLDHGAGNDGAVLEHIFQIHQVTIVHMLGIIVRVVEMDDASLVGIHNGLGQQNTGGDILADLASHIVTLDSIDGGVLVGVLLLDLLVVGLDEGQDPVVGGVGLAGQRPGVAVSDIGLGHLKGAVGHNSLLHQVLDLFHGRAAAHFLAGNGDPFCDPLDLQGSHTHLFVHGSVSLGDGHFYLTNIKNDFGAVSLNDFHIYFLRCPLGFKKRASGNIIYYILCYFQEAITKWPYTFFQIPFVHIYKNLLFPRKFNSRLPNLRKFPNFR